MATMCQVSLDDCYCGGSKRYYLDIAAPEQSGLRGASFCLRADERLVRVVKFWGARTDLKMADELLIEGAIGTMCQVILGDCYRGSNKRYYLATTGAKEPTGYVGLLLPQGG